MSYLQRNASSSVRNHARTLAPALVLAAGPRALTVRQCLRDAA